MFGWLISEWPTHVVGLKEGGSAPRSSLCPLHPPYLLLLLLLFQPHHCCSQEHQLRDRMAVGQGPIASWGVEVDDHTVWPDMCVCPCSGD